MQHRRSDGAGDEVWEETAAGHCRGHVKGLGLCTIFRESIERCYVDKFWDLFAFLVHFFGIFWAKHYAVSIIESSYKW